MFAEYEDVGNGAWVVSRYVTFRGVSVGQACRTYHRPVRRRVMYSSVWEPAGTGDIGQTSERLTDTCPSAMVMSDDGFGLGGPGRARQAEIYIDAMVAGNEPEFPISFDELRAAAKEAMDPEAYGYIAGGAGQEETMANNDRAFDRWQIVPRMLRGIDERDLSTELFGEELSVPFMLAPIGAQDCVHEEGDLVSARAAADLAVPIVHSTQASDPMEDVAEVLGDTPAWFQLYWSSERELTASLVDRAEAAGYSAVVLTVDTLLLGWRERDLKRGYLPFLEGQGLGNYFSDPVFREGLDAPPDEKPLLAARHFIDVYSNPALTWDDLDWLCEYTDLPVLLKGILHPEDAALAVEHGVDGVVVSNHGGRQVDGSIGALDALPRVAERLDDTTVLFDSGIRTGADVIKALALGAEAVLYGRPWLYGLGIGGEDGVRHVLENFRADLDLTVGLSGYTDVDDIDRSCLIEAP